MWMWLANYREVFLKLVLSIRVRFCKHFLVAVKDTVKEEILTKASKSCAWQRSQSSLRVYRAFSVTESTGPFEICWVRADTNRKRGCPTDSYGGNIYIREHTWVFEEEYVLSKSPTEWMYGRTLRKPYRQMDIQFVRSFSTMDSVRRRRSLGFALLDWSIRLCRRSSMTSVR